MENIKTARKILSDVSGVVTEALDKLDLLSQYGADATLNDICHDILVHYYSPNPSVGDVQSLQDSLSKILTEEFHVSASKFE